MKLWGIRAERCDQSWAPSEVTVDRTRHGRSGAVGLRTWSRVVVASILSRLLVALPLFIAEKDTYRAWVRWAQRCARWRCPQQAVDLEVAGWQSAQ